jgi:hypothetical protein
MPTQQPIANTMIPREVEKPIPTRTVTTKSQNINQPGNNVVSPAAESATPAESVRLSPQLSALARKEQALRQERAAFLEEKKSLEARLAEAEKYSQLKTKLQSKDFSEMEELGLTYEEYTKYLLDKQNGEDPQAQKFKTLEDELQALKKAQEDNAALEYEETVAAYQKEIAKHVESSSDLPLTKKAKKEDAVLRLILDSWEKDGEELTVEQASKDVEEFLKQEAKNWASLIEEPKVSGAHGPGPLPPPRTGSRTLTQNMQPPSGQAAPAKSLQHLSESERYAEARRRVEARRQQGV